MEKNRQLSQCIRRNLNVLLLAVVAVCAPGASWASCTLTSGGASVMANFGGISDPNMYSVGQYIGPATNVTFSLSCMAGNTGDLNYQIQYALSGPGGQVLPGVMETNVPGIAVEVRDAATGTALASGNNIITRNVTLSLGATPNYSTTVTLALQLKRSTASPIVAGQSINMGNFISVSSTSGTGSNSLLTIGLSSNPVLTGTCRVFPGMESMALSLPPVSSRDLAQGVNVSSPLYAIRFSCQSALQEVYVGFTDANDPGNTSDVLSLAPGSTAANVGIQIFLSGSSTPVSFGPDTHVVGSPNQIYLGRPSQINFDDSGTGNFGLVARYKATGTPVTAGTVNAVATYTFAYP